MRTRRRISGSREASPFIEKAECITWQFNDRKHTRERRSGNKPARYYPDHFSKWRCHHGYSKSDAFTVIQGREEQPEICAVCIGWKRNVFLGCSEYASWLVSKSGWCKHRNQRNPESNGYRACFLWITVQRQVQTKPVPDNRRIIKTAWCCFCLCIAKPPIADLILQ